MAKPKITANCLHCGTEFHPQYERVKCCSRSCAGFNRVGPLATRFWTHVHKGAPGDCWIFKPQSKALRYRQLKVGGSRSPSLAHRVSWELAHGHIPDGLVVCHRCDNPPCVNPAHLFLGTHKDNSQDMAHKGKSQRGERNTKAKLTADDVIAIRLSAKSGREIAKDYGIQPTQVSHIRLRKQWKHV